jgi:hypothetical protein
MSISSRSMPLPTPGDVRTCNRWACLQRVQAPGLDPAALAQLVETVVREVAASIVCDFEEAATPKPFDAYAGLFLEQFWAGVPHLADPHYPQALLAAAENRGATCLQILVERMLPRFMTNERLLLHHQQFTWTIPDGRGGTLTLRGCITRLAEDRASTDIRVYDWHLEDWQSIDWQAYARHQRAEIAAGWARSKYPDRQVTIVKAYLASDVTLASTWSADEQRGLEIMLQAQTMLAEQETTTQLFGCPPAVMGLN